MRPVAPAQRSCTCMHQLRIHLRTLLSLLHLLLLRLFPHRLTGPADHNTVQSWLG